MRIMFELYYSFFRYFLLSCRYEMFQKRILSKPKLGLHKQLLGGTDPVATALLTWMMILRCQMLPTENSHMPYRI